jgi:predicted histone-like DNA-binding protein
MSQTTISVYQNNNAFSKGYHKFYGRVKHSTVVDEKTLCMHVAKDSGIEESDVATVYDALFKQIEEQLCNGHPIKVDCFGTLKVSFSSTGVSAAEVKEKFPKFDPETEDIRKYLSVRQIKNARLLFQPCADVKTLLRSVKFMTDKSEWETPSPDPGPEPGPEP